MFGYAHNFSSFIVVCNHLKCYTTYDHFIICTLCENKQLKKLINQKRKMYYSPQYSYVFFFG
jgi:hypothetical protein